MKRLKAPVKRQVELHPTMHTVERASAKDRLDGYVLAIPDSTVRLNPTRVVPDTYLRVTKKSKEVRCLVTIMPDGLLVAWDSCGTCHRYFSICKCFGGVAVPRCIEYIYDQTVAKRAGEEWTRNHKNYLGSLTRPERESRAAHGRTTRTFGPLVATEPPETPSGPYSASQPTPSKPPGKSLQAPTSELPPEATDLGALNRAANTLQGDLTKRLTKSLKSSPPPTKKLLKKNKITEGASSS